MTVATQLGKISIIIYYQQLICWQLIYVSRAAHSIEWRGPHLPSAPGPGVEL